MSSILAITLALCTMFLCANGQGLLASVAESVAETVVDATGDVLAADDYAKIQLILFTRAKNASYLIANATDLLADPAFDAALPTVVYTHGYQESRASESVGVVSRAFLQRGSHNFILVDWSPYAQPPYLAAFLRVIGVSEAVGEALGRMVQAGLSRDGVWLVGHSLGGQMAGIMSRSLDFKPKRISALDPALPGYNTPGFPTLTRDDAVLVDVIHTDAGVFGYDRDCGHVDFWPNGGYRVQPGCDPVETTLDDSLLFCSHHRSWEFFAESVNNETALPAVRCGSWGDFEVGACPPNGTNLVYLGYRPATDREGRFYLRTSSESPFGLGLAGVEIQNSTSNSVFELALNSTSGSSELTLDSTSGGTHANASELPEETSEQLQKSILGVPLQQLEQEPQQKPTFGISSFIDSILSKTHIFFEIVLTRR